jgi:two-component system, LytTR family, response regulator
MEKIFIRTSTGVKAVAPGNIIRIQASSNYCKIFFANDYPLTVAKLLHWFENKLPAHSFCRIHRGHIINRDFISLVSSDSKVTLQNGEQLQVSKRKKKEFRLLVA